MRFTGSKYVVGEAVAASKADIVVCEEKKSGEQFVITAPFFEDVRRLDSESAWVKKLNSMTVAIVSYDTEKDSLAKLYRAIDVRKKPRFGRVLTMLERSWTASMHPFV